MPRSLASSLLAFSALAGLAVLGVACGGAARPEVDDKVSAIQGTSPAGAGDALGCWTPGSRVELYVNTSLASALDPKSEGAARLQALRSAAAAWNAELAAIDSKVTIAIVDASQQKAASTPAGWDSGARGNAVRCEERGTSNKVAGRAFNTNSVNAVSFASTSIGPGYSASAIPESYSVDALAETQTSRGTNGFFGESDVVFHTHDASCSAIPWHFDGSEPIAQNEYDFASVALHELGHVLGLDHIPSNGTSNVMQTAFAPGIKYTINALDRHALAELYNGCGVAGSGGGGGQPGSAGGSSSSSGGVQELPGSGSSSGQTK